MNATGQLWDRQQHRIDYFGDVRLSSPIGNETIVARAENLSETGVFLVTSEPCQIGQEVVCELPLGAERLILRGRVAWVRPHTASGGMGVEFLDLRREDARTLRQVVGTPMTDSLHVSVRFEGMPEPIRAEALSTSSGIYLRTSLPFLRLNSPVELHFKDGRRPPQQGWLEDVTLYADEQSPVPRLQVHVAQRHEEGGAGVPSLELEDDVEVAAATPAVDEVPAVVEASEDRALPSVMVDESMIADGASSECEEPMPLVQLKHRPTSQRPHELDEQLLPPSEDAPYELPQDPAERSYWDFEGIPGMDPDEEDARFWERSSPPRHRLALWMSALVMLALALASAHVTGFYATARTAMTRWSQSAWAIVDGETPKTASVPPLRVASLAPPSTVGSAPPPPTLTSTPTPVSTSPAIPKVTSTVVPPVATSAKTPLSPSPTPATRGPEAREAKALTTAKVVLRPEIAVHGHETTIRLPIHGSLRGKRSYPLAHPAGVVVRLPNARSALRYGSYPLNRGGLRLLWVKRYEKGVRFRVLFSRSKPSCRLAILKDSVRVTCTEASKLASP